MKEYISNSLDDTFKIASEIKNSLNKGDVVLLRGDLGAGKTQFVKKVVKAFGGDENIVTSPTFTIVNEYSLDNQTIFHFDLYRINNQNELYNIGVEEYFYSDAICFVEWPERAEDMFDFAHKQISIYKLSETSRKIIFEEK